MDPAPSYGDGAVYGPPSGGAMAPSPATLRFNLPNVSVLGFLQGLTVMGIVDIVLMVAVMVLATTVLVRVVDKDITVATPGSVSGTTTAAATNVVSCRGLACEQASPANAYQCRRPDGVSAGVLTAADAWVLLGDDFASGGNAGASSWWSRLLARTSATSSESTTRIYNEAGPGVGQVANITLQVGALRRDRTAASMLAHDSNERVVIFVGIGRSAQTATLPNGLGAMFDALWGPGPDALVTSRAASRMTVVMVVPPDPYWGDVEPSATYRQDVVSTCGTDVSWWDQKQWRRQTHDKLAVTAARHGAVLVELDDALGRFSLANDGTAFEARCTSSSRGTPEYNQRGSYAVADVLWQCLETGDGTYDVPKVLAS